MAQRRSTKERQRQIAAAALKLISEKGVGGFTTAALSQEVGLAEGTIFRHFSNKEEIALAAISLLEDRLAESFPPEGGDPLERLGLFMRHRLQLVLAHRGVLRAFFSDQLAMIAGEEGVLRMKRIKKRSISFMAQCLQEASEQGLLRGPLPPEFLMRVIQGTVHSFLFGGPSENTSTNPDEPLLAERAAQIWSHLFTLISRSSGED